VGARLEEGGEMRDRRLLLCWGSQSEEVGEHEHEDNCFAAITRIRNVSLP
jgi:hypothetical protein